MQESKINLALLWSMHKENVTSVNDLVLGLDKKRFNVIFIYLSGCDVDKNSIEEAGYKVLYLFNTKRIRAFRFSILFKLIKILREHKIDILHCHAHKSTVYGTIAAIFARTSVVMSHVHGLNRSRNFRRKLVNFLLLRKVSRIIPVANSVKEDVLKNNWFLSAKKLSVLENSIDYKRFADVKVSKQEVKQMLGLSQDTFIFSTIARFGSYKGHDFLISAFEKVKKQVPTAHLLLVGEGALKDELQRQVSKVGISQSVHFLGQRNDIPELLRAVDAFVLPSIGSEGMPRVLLEAMAAGVPCIGTRIGGTPEVLCNSEIGYIVEPKDSNALARAMISIAQASNVEREEFVEKAQNRVRQCYSHRVVIEKLRMQYEGEYQSHCKPR